jgi:hypothetical protein
VDAGAQATRYNPGNGNLLIAFLLAFLCWRTLLLLMYNEPGIAFRLVPLEAGEDWFIQLVIGLSAKVSQHNMRFVIAMTQES